MPHDLFYISRIMDITSDPMTFRFITIFVRDDFVTNNPKPAEHVSDSIILNWKFTLYKQNIHSEVAKTSSYFTFAMPKFHACAISNAK